MPKSSAFQSIQERLNRLFEETLQLHGDAARFEPEVEQVWSPPMDVFETDDEIVLSAEIPGVPRSELSLELTDNVLTLRGERRAPSGADTFHRMERHYGAFERTFELPVAVDPDRIEATYRGGVLTVRLQKKAGTTGSSIRIEVSP